MRITFNVDEEALEAALKVSPGKTKADVINEALREFARRRRVQDFLEFEGKMHWGGDLDALRGPAGQFEGAGRCVGIDGLPKGLSIAAKCPGGA